MFSKILFGTDGSEAAARALGAACQLAQKCNAELCVFHVPRPDTVAFAMGAVSGYHVATTMPHEEDVEAAAQKVLDEAISTAKAAGVAVASAAHSRGEPADEIVAHAQTIGADVIVTGRRGLGNLTSLILGSTSQRINHIASCAVLTVP